MSTSKLDAYHLLKYLKHRYFKFNGRAFDRINSYICNNINVKTFFMVLVEIQVLAR